MALEGDEVGLENLFVDTSDTTVTFPNCPDFGEFSNVGILCAQPVQRSLTAEEDQLTGYVMLKDARSQFKLSFHFSQVGWYNSLTDTFD